MQNYVWPLLLPILFLAYSMPIFLRVYATTQSVIDEEFHLRQGLHFCNQHFNEWDTKITTFPGLYMVSLILLPFDFCSVLGLRLISLAAATINVALLYKIRRRVLGCTNSGLAALDAFTISALPPLYFFSHLYYTDTVALTTILCFYYNWQKEMYLQSAVYGAASILIRQTNVVWIGMVFGIIALDDLCKNYANDKRLKLYEVHLFNPKTLWSMLLSYKVMFRTVVGIFGKCCFYAVIILPFVLFIYLNGSIVLGDKDAHVAEIHLPQLLYFSAFTLIFGVSNTLDELKYAIGVIRRQKRLAVILLILCLITVKYNTLVHPYLLSDNRHYIFYIWNRFYGRYVWFKYAMAPVYVLALFLMYSGLRHMRDSFKLMYAVAVILMLCFQRLLELRYFLIPFIIFRLNLVSLKKSRATQWLELSFYIVLNALTFYIFFTKEFRWENFQEPQRIIW